MTGIAAPPRAALVIGAARPFGDEIVAALAGAGYAVATGCAGAAATLDLLVVNTPVEPRHIRFRAMSDAAFAEPLETQLYDFVAAVQFAVPRMGAGGAIVHVASAAHLGTWGGVDVAAAGAAGVAMARSMALELAGQGIRVNTLAAGFVGAAGDDAGARADIAASVVWLAGAGSRAITGETILANRGGSLTMALAARR